MLIFEGLMLSHFAKNFKQALLALPSTGAEVKHIFKASLYTPFTSLLDVRGCIIAEKRIPLS
jgi:hypothetical protein